MGRDFLVKSPDICFCHLSGNPLCVTVEAFSPILVSSTTSLLTYLQVCYCASAGACLESCRITFTARCFLALVVLRWSSCRRVHSAVCAISTTLTSALPKLFVWSTVSCEIVSSVAETETVIDDQCLTDLHSLRVVHHTLWFLVFYMSWSYIHCFWEEMDW